MTKTVHRTLSVFVLVRSFFVHVWRLLRSLGLLWRLLIVLPVMIMRQLWLLLFLLQYVMSLHQER